MNLAVDTETSAGGEVEGEQISPVVGQGVATRVVLEQFDITATNMAKVWGEQDKYIDMLESRVRELEEKGRVESSRRENLLVMRLTAKEQELQEMAAQIAELKSAQAPSTAVLRSTLLDPAVNLVIQRLTKECDQLKKAAEEAQNELAAWKFTPDSATGKRLMAKCRQLYQENEDLGKMIASGRLAKLEGELALQKNLTEEMKKNQQEMDEFMAELDEDVEGMQSTIYYLQQQLREARETIGKLEAQLGGNKGDYKEDRDTVEEEVKVERKDIKAERFDSPSRRGEKVDSPRESKVASRQATPVKSEEEEIEAGARQGRRGDRGRNNESPVGKRGRGRGRGRNASRSDIDDEEKESGGRRGKRKRGGAGNRSTAKKSKKNDSESEDNTDN